MKKLILALTLAALAGPALADGTAVLVGGPTTTATVATMSAAVADAAQPKPVTEADK